MGPAEVDVRPHLGGPPMLVRGMRGKAADCRAADQGIVPLPDHVAGCVGRGERAPGYPERPSREAVDRGRIETAEGAAEIGRHRLDAALVAADTLADDHTKADVVLAPRAGEAKRAGDAEERFEVAGDGAAIAEPFLVEVPAVIQPGIVQYEAGLDMAPGLLSAAADDAAGPVAFRRVECRRVRDACGGEEVCV